MMKENSYGILKRFNFIIDVINSEFKNKNKINILDVGCGTGAYLTIPLAKKLNNANITAFDKDNNSIEFIKEMVRKENIHNIEPTVSLDCIKINKNKFDVIIISEVLEHLEDPSNFLRTFIDLSHNNTLFIITIPNGYGIFEIDHLIFKTLKLCLKICQFETVIKKVKELIKRRKNSYEYKPDTYAYSPHINFFTYCGIMRLFYNVGLKVALYKGRTFACGPLTSRIIDKFNWLININIKLGDILPPHLVSGWMFVLKHSEDVKYINKNCMFYDSIFHKLYARIKRLLNKKVM